MERKMDCLKTQKNIGRISILPSIKALGNCHSVTYPRVSTVITGVRQDGSTYSDGYQANLKYFKCDWTPRKPEEYLLSNALCLHIREMIELQNGIEMDNVRNVLILNTADSRTYVMDDSIYPQIENIWVNQNIIFNSDEMERLNALGQINTGRIFVRK
jgi:adenine-specific DNA-methyltransferase